MRRSAVLTHRVDDYAIKVHDGAIVAGPLVRLAAKRHIDDRMSAASKAGHRARINFSVEAADHVIEFYEEILRLPDTLDEDGDPVPFLLTPANTFIVGSIFGWKRRDGYRRFREAYIEMGKGNAKTPLAAGMGLYGLTMDGEQAAEIYSVATGIDQARICWLDADRMVEASPELAEIIHRSKDNLAYAATYGWFRPLSKEKRGKSGPRPHMAFFDELHEYPDAVNVNKIRAGSKRRPQPLFVDITNSGFDRTSVCWHHHEHARKVLEGIVEDEALFGYVCGLDKSKAKGNINGYENPFTDRRCHPKANPNLGYIIKQDYLDRQVANAANIPSETNTVLRLNFCMWTASHSQAWTMAAWHASGAIAIRDEDLIGAPCYGGLDLGQTDDFAAWARLWDLGALVVVKMRFWLPRAALTKYPDRPYEQWERAGVLTVTEGDTTDVDLIEETVIEDCRTDGVLELAYDKRFAHQMALHIQGAGITCVDTPQGFALNESIVNLQKIITDEAVAHGNNPIMTWQMDNTVVRHGTNKQIRLDKEQSKDKIDGPSALVMANDRRIHQPKEAPAEDPVIISA